MHGLIILAVREKKRAQFWELNQFIPLYQERAITLMQIGKVVNHVLRMSRVFYSCLNKEAMYYQHMRLMESLRRHLSTCGDQDICQRAQRIRIYRGMGIA